MGALPESRVYDCLQLAFSLPPAAAGRRLKSEPLLAELLGIKRTQLRKILDRFVDSGILIRRHGSGTFLRKVLEAPPEASRAGVVTLVDPFSDLEPEESRRRMSATDSSLRFAVLSDFLSPHLSGTYRGIFEGLASRCCDAGHTVEIHRSVHELESGAKRSKILKSLRETPYDGVIVRADRDELFQMMDEASRPLALYIEVAMARKEVEPIINFGRKEAMRRALKLLAAEGATKIALVGWSTPGHNEEYRRTYLDAILEMGLGYTACQFLSEDEKKNRIIFNMLVGPYSDAPDALYFVDDVALRHAVDLFKEHSLIPGDNIRVIAEADQGVSLPVGFQWSVMMFNPFQVGRLAVDCLESAIQTTGDELVSLTHEASWKPGLTHQIKKP